MEAEHFVWFIEKTTSRGNLPPKMVFPFLKLFQKIVEFLSWFKLYQKIIIE